MRMIQAENAARPEPSIERAPVGEASTAGCDILGEVLDAVHLRAEIGLPCSIAAPWNLAMEPGAAGFFVVLAGRSRLETADESGHWLEAGDMAVVTRSAPHRLVSGPGQRETCTIVQGRFDFEHRGFAPLKTALPPELLTRGTGGAPQAWLADVLRIAHRELGQRRLGSHAIINRLGHIIYLSAVREYAAEMPRGRGGWLGAILSPDLGPAIGAMHLRPEATWTVETLADEAGLSRSVFAERFAGLVGMTPMRYLLECRMLRALSLLKDRSLGIKEVALRVGYGSEAAFGNAFKRWAGVSPGAFRESGREPSLTASPE